MAIKVLIINERQDQNEPCIDFHPRGFSVHKINAGKMVVNDIREMKPDVIIIDSSGPDQDNGNAYWNLRAISKAPILVLSVVDKPGIVEKVLDRGADEYLLKPVSPGLLAARINALARRTYRDGFAA